MGMLRVDAVQGNDVHTVSYIERKVNGNGRFIVELRMNGKLTDRWTYKSLEMVDALVRYAHVVNCLYTGIHRAVAHDNAVLTTEPGEYEENPEE